MLSNIRRLVGLISVREVNGRITLSGIPVSVMERDIKKLWNTSRIQSHMFLKTSRSQVSFHSFYALEVQFILESILKSTTTLLSRRIITQILTLLHSETWLKETTIEPTSKLDLSTLSLFHKKPLPHQQRFLGEYDTLTQQYRLNGYYLASDPGTGKTLMNLYLKEALHADVHIVISPKNAVERVWVKSLVEEYKRPRLNYWTSLSSTPPPKDVEFYICHYEQIHRLLAIVPDLKRLGKKIFLTLDESHNMNDLKSMQTQRFVELCLELDIQESTWSSGTPIKAMGAEMIPYLTVTTSDFTVSVAESFKKIFGLSSSRAVSILQHRLGRSMTRVDQSEVRKSQLTEEDLKVTFKNANYFTMESVIDRMRVFVEERTEYYSKNKKLFELNYKEALDHFKTTLKTKADHEAFTQYQRFVNMIRKVRDLRAYRDEVQWCNRYEKTRIIPSLPRDMKQSFVQAKSVVKYVHLKIRGEALGKILGRARIECSVELTKNIDYATLLRDATKSTLIFTNYVDALIATEEVTKRLGYKPQVIYGDTNKQLNQILERASKDPSLTPIIATYDSLSTAVPLTFVSNIIMLDHPFRQYIRDQAIARADRLGNDDVVYLYNILLDTGADVNVSSRSMDIQKWYKQQVDLMLGIEDADTPSTESIGFIDRSDFFTVDSTLPASLRW